METGKTRALSRMPVGELRGVGPKIAQQLARVGVTSVQDLLFHLPLHYQDRTRVVPITDLKPGAEVLVEGEVRDIGIGYCRCSLKVWLADASGREKQTGILLRFFHFSGRQAAALKPGTKLRCFGEVRYDLQSLEMVHPEYRHYGPDEPPPPEAALTPIYPTTKGVQQILLASAHGSGPGAAGPGRRHAGGMAAAGGPGTIPVSDPGRGSASSPPTTGLDLIGGLARSSSSRPAPTGVRRVGHQLGLRRLRHRQQRIRAPVLDGDRRLRARLLAGLPFALTAAQRRVTEEIARDLQRPYPMLRLLQGDVGSGKTVVAALASLQTVESGRQVALMAPTELLSEHTCVICVAGWSPWSWTPCG